MDDMLSESILLELLEEGFSHADVIEVGVALQQGTLLELLDPHDLAGVLTEEDLVEIPVIGTALDKLQGVIGKPKSIDWSGLRKKAKTGVMKLARGIDTRIRNRKAKAALAYLQKHAATTGTKLPSLMKQLSKKPPKKKGPNFIQKILGRKPYEPTKAKKRPKKKIPGASAPVRKPAAKPPLKLVRGGQQGQGGQRTSKQKAALVKAQKAAAQAKKGKKLSNAQKQAMLKGRKKAGMA
jgi:hypothetical protein